MFKKQVYELFSLQRIEFLRKIQFFLINYDDEKIYLLNIRNSLNPIGDGNTGITCRA